MRGKKFFKEFLKGFFKGLFMFDLKLILGMCTLRLVYNFLNSLYFKGGFPLDFDFLPFLRDNITCYPEMPLQDRKDYQELLVTLSLRLMQWNEICFYINPNSIEFLEAKILYQVKLNFFLEKLNLDDFDDPNEALLFITEFYDHYLKLIELNNEVINNISMNAQYYNNYNIFCVFLYRIIFFIISIKFIYHLFVSFEKR
jgi:hypothetical protein